MRVGIVGPGRAGLGLALALRRAGVAVVGLHGRRPKRVPRGLTLTLGARPPWLVDADIVVLAVRDDAIPAARAMLAGPELRDRVVLHLSGVHTARALAPLRRHGAAVGAMHPLMTVSGDPRRAAAMLAGATFAVEGDVRAVRAARALARRLGAHPVAIAPGAKARYHAGAVFASNYVVTLLAEAETLLVAAGFTRRAARSALAPLARATVENVAAAGPVAALTGPLRRGDARTIRAHLRALPAAARAPYVALAERTLVLARAAGTPTPALARLRRLLGVRSAGQRR